MTATTARALLVALATHGPATARAQRPARITVLADSVSVGERVLIAVAVDHGPGRSAVFPDVPPGDPEAGPLLAFGDAEAFSVRRLPPRVRGSVRTDSTVYTVAVFAVDTARVGPVRVRLVSGRDTVDVPTGVALVPVRSELAGEGEPEPAPIGPADPFPSLLALWVALAIATALAVGVALWAFRTWRRRPGPAVPRPEPYPEATAALDGLAAPAATPEAASEQPLGAREATRHALRLADLVAFAGHAPPPDAAADAVQSARAAVDGIEQAVRPAAPTPAADGPRPGRPAAPDASPSARP